MVMSAATRGQLHRVTDPSGVLLLLVLEHPAIDTARLVNDTRDWVIGTTTYVGLPFRFKLPDAISGQAPRAQIEIDNVGNALTAELEKLPLGGALMATFSIVSRNTPTVVDWTFQAQLSGVAATVQAVTANVGNDDALRAPAVKVRFDPATSPGLFAG
jgi:hypothetical protein